MDSGATNGGEAQVGAKSEDGGDDNGEGSVPGAKSEAGGNDATEETPGGPATAAAVKIKSTAQWSIHD